MEETTKPIRPLGIAILSWLHIIGGASGAAVLLLMCYSANPNSHEALATTGMSAGVTFVAGLSFALSFICGVGLWTGRLWGWYLGSFSWIYSALDSLNALIPMPSLTSTPASHDATTMPHGPVFYFVTYGTRVVVGLFIYSYFFKSNVRSFFAVSEARKWNTFLPEVGIALAIIVVTTLVKQQLAR
jgi:hypothetical protein